MKLYKPTALVLLGTSGVFSHVGHRHNFNDMSNEIESRYADENSDSAETMPSSNFGTQLFAAVVDNFPSGNILISPVSIAKALEMVLIGTTEGSDTEMELKQVLGPPSLVETTVDDESDVQLTIANSVWADKLKQSYIDDLAKNFNADAFKLPSRYSTIDKWIEENTNGMIKDMLGDEKIPRDVLALLVNAVYFKGKWKMPFDPKMTIDGDFKLRDRTTTEARYMTATRSMKYIDSIEELGGASAVVLDYGDQIDEDSEAETEFTSLFIRPASDDTDSMNDIITGLTSQPITDLLEQASDRIVSLKLPRFKLAWGDEGAESLKDTLEDMGITSAFEDWTDGKFDRMTTRPDAYLDDVLHSASKVTEQGTEASASTVARINIRRRPTAMIFDRPFVVAIVHRPTGEAVFLGRVEDPELDFE